jgi:hypothetical protein
LVTNAQDGAGGTEAMDALVAVLDDVERAIDFGRGRVDVGATGSRDHAKFLTQIGPVDHGGPSRAILCQFCRQEELERVMERWFEKTEWDERDYIVDRAQLLNRVFTDQVLWEQSLAAFAEGASLSATWVDGCGQQHVVAINRAFLDAHARIVRSLWLDLQACGAEGQRAIQTVVALQLSMLREERAG